QGLIDELLDRPYPTPGEPEPAVDPADAPELKGKEYNVVAMMFDQADPAATMNNVTKAIEQHANVKCVVGLNGYHTPIIVKALDQSKKLDQIKIVGFDVDKETLAGIEAG